MVHINNFVDKIYCINLKERTDRRRDLLANAKQYNIKNIFFFDAVKHKEGWRGCLLSHFNILKDAKKNGYNKILILEDDCDFTSKPEFDTKQLPKDWDMLYLGANVVEVLDKDNYKNIMKKTWVKVSCLTTSCMIIHKKAIDKLIKLLEKCDEPIDLHYVNKFHPENNCFILNKMISTQRTGWSDIENKSLQYYFNTVEDKIKIDNSPFEYNKETKDYKLKLDYFEDDQLPYVSILTPTKNRKKLFPIAIECFNNFIYPKEKIEWIIVDDSDDGSSLVDILPNDSRIKYKKINTKKKIPVSMKRNLCAKFASHDILIHMDDDDYYTPISILSRVKVLMTYPKINMVGCGIIRCYDVKQKVYYDAGGANTLAEATMAYRKSFWKKKQFNNKIELGEGILFLKDRKDECYQIPHDFVMCAINHKGNMTGSIRRVNDTKYHLDIQLLPDEILELIEKIHK